LRPPANGCSSGAAGRGRTRLLVSAADCRKLCAARARRVSARHLGIGVRERVGKVVGVRLPPRVRVRGDWASTHQNGAGAAGGSRGCDNGDGGVKTSEGGDARRARNLFIELEDEREDIVHTGTPRGRAASREPRRVTARKVARLQALGAGCGRARAGGLARGAGTCSRRCSAWGFAARRGRARLIDAGTGAAPDRDAQQSERVIRGSRQRAAGRTCQCGRELERTSGVMPSR
jgi:hypothetical protein